MLTRSRLALLLEAGAPGEAHMRRDSELLRLAAAGEIAGALRLYWFDPPCLSLGRMQPESDVDSVACARDGIDVVRRPSGGRAVLHRDEVTYALVCSDADPDLGGDVLTSCARIHIAVARGLAILGVRVRPQAMPRRLRDDARDAGRVADCFAHPAAHELVDPEGRKLVGSAQARRGVALLQHGSVMLEPPRAHDYLRGPGGDADSAGPGYASPGLRALAGRHVSRQEAVLALAAGFSQVLGERMLDTPL